ncbi:MAG: serine kinase [Erythrobacter sp.]
MSNECPFATYHAFGMIIQSEIPLTGLIRSEHKLKPDIIIKYGIIDHERIFKDHVSFMDFENLESVVMYWPSVGCFNIIGGETIIVHPADSVKEAFLAFPILGPVIAWALDRKKLFLLHASAVEINGRAAVFMGDKLAGKSTTAAAFIRAGHTLITDDLVAISFAEPDKPTIQPAFPQIKLAADAAAAVPIPEATALPLIHKDFPKRQHTLASMTKSAVPVDWFFQLERGRPSVELITMNLNEAIITLNRYSYMSRFSGINWPATDEGRHFKSCVKLATSSKVGKLYVPAGLERLPDTVASLTKLLSEKPKM